MKRLALWLMLVLAFVGIADASYLAGQVATPGPYTNVLGHSIAEYGIFFYAIIFALAAVELFFVRFYIRRLIQLLVAVGLIVSAYFMVLQISIVEPYCVYCSLSAGLTFLLFIIAYFIEPITRTTTIELGAPHLESHLVLPPPRV